MQIFVPFADVERSLRCLDRKRLFCQLREALQCLETIKALQRHHADPSNHAFPSYGNHPAVRSWKQSVRYLTWYACTCSVIIRSTLFTKEGIPYRTQHWDERLRNEHGGWIEVEPVEDRPAWWGRECIHASHRGMLYNKDPSAYPEFAKEGAAHQTYAWPVPLLSASSKKRSMDTPAPWAPIKAIRQEVRMPVTLRPCVLFMEGGAVHG